MTLGNLARRSPDLSERLPIEEWTRFQLGNPDVATIIMGQSPNSSTYNTIGDGLPFFQGKVDFGLRHPAPTKWCSSPARVAEPGDVLVSVRAPVGDANLAIERCCIGRGLAALRPGPRALSDFLFYLIMHHKPDLDGLSSGAIFNAINKNALESFQVLLPAISEQQAIAAVLSKIQAAVEVQEKLVTTLQELKAATMAKLFRQGIIKGLMFDTNVFDDLIDGKLDIAALPKGTKIYATHIQMDEIARCPDQERRTRLQEVFNDAVHAEVPTASLVIGTSRVGKARLGDGVTFQNLRGGSARNTHDALIAETAIKDGLVLVTNDKGLRERVRKAGGESISTDDLLAGKLRPTKQTEIGEIPESWELMRLDSVTELVSGGTPSKRRPEWWEGSIPWASPKDMKRPRLWDTQDHVTEEAIENGSRLVPAKTIFVVIRGMILAKDVPVAITEVPMAFNQDMKAVIAKPSVDADFLLYAICSRTQALEKAISTSAHGTRRMGTASVEELLVPLPTKKEEQQAIAKALQRLEEQEELVSKKRNELKALFSSMLHLLMTGRVRVTRKMIALQALEERAKRRPKWSGKVDEKLLEEIVRRIVEAVAPEKIILFGSAARGEMGPDSDVDLLVIKACDSPREVERQIYRRLIGIGVPKDVFVVTPQHLEKHKDTIGYIYRPALREGKVIYAG